jgi:hypothetical protein
MIAIVARNADSATVHAFERHIPLTQFRPVVSTADLATLPPGTPFEFAPHWEKNPQADEIRQRANEIAASAPAVHIKPAARDRFEKMTDDAKRLFRNREWYGYSFHIMTVPEKEPALVAVRNGQVKYLILRTQDGKRVWAKEYHQTRTDVEYSDRL